MFLYKDFVVREILFNAGFSEKLQEDYESFVKNDFTQWVNLLLEM
jgi:hypothetical protein